MCVSVVVRSSLCQSSINIRGLTRVEEHGKCCVAVDGKTLQVSYEGVDGIIFQVLWAGMGGIAVCG